MSYTSLLQPSSTGAADEISTWCFQVIFDEWTAQQMKTTTLTVAIPNYNMKKYIPVCLEAVLAQSDQIEEIIIIDDGSTDGSVEILRQYSERYSKINLILNVSNQGVLANLNRLLSLARGDYIFFHAIDDMILPEFIKKSMEMLESHPSAALCSTLSMDIDEHGACLGISPSPVVTWQSDYISPEKAARALYRHGSWFMGNVTIYNKRMIESEGGFDPSLGSFTDGFLTQVLTLKHGACFIPEILGCWRRCQSGFSASTAGDLNKMKEMTNAAFTKMTGKYRELFPSQYVKRWRNEMDYYIRLKENGIVPPQAMRNNSALSLFDKVKPGPHEIRYGMYAKRIRTFVSKWALNNADAANKAKLARTLDAYRASIDPGLPVDDYQY